MAKKQHKERQLTEAEKKLLEKYPDGQIPFDHMMQMAVNTTPKGGRKKTELITEGKVDLAALLKKVATSRDKEGKKKTAKKKK